MLAVQKFLREHGETKLEQRYGIKIRRYADRIVLNYGMIESKKHRFDDIVRECRGLILGLPDYNILARSFDRFFNYGEDPQSSAFSIENAICFEKIDGSLMSLYHDGDQWCVATRGMAFAEGECLYGNGETFHDLFMQASGLNDLQDFTGSSQWTYIFELVSPKSRVVKPYSNTEIYLLGSRRRYDGFYCIPSMVKSAESIQYNLPKLYEFKTMDDCLVALGRLPTFDEGYVLLDYTTDWRIKIKSPAYLAIAHLRSNGQLSERRVISMIINGDDEEYLSYFPGDAEFIKPHQDAIDGLRSEAMDMFDIYGGIKSRKKFAMIVKDHRCAPLLFGLMDGKTVADILTKMKPNNRTELVKRFM